LALTPLGMPDFRFDRTSSSPAGVEVAPVATVEPVPEPFDAAVADLGGEGGAAQVAVVGVLSLLLLGGAAVARAQEQRHRIP
jgi:hypothetical protein